jgi:hypothetical protein
MAIQVTLAEACFAITVTPPSLTVPSQTIVRQGTVAADCIAVLAMRLSQTVCSKATYQLRAVRLTTVQESGVGEVALSSLDVRLIPTSQMGMGMVEACIVHPPVIQCLRIASLRIILPMEITEVVEVSIASLIAILFLNHVPLRTMKPPVNSQIMVVESIAGVGVPRSQIVFLRGTFQMHMAVACIA